MGRNSQYQQDVGSSKPHPQTQCITCQNLRKLLCGIDKPILKWR